MPDFTDREQLVAWLRTQPAEVSVAIASRTALRLLPFLAELSGPRVIARKRRSDIVMPVIRAMVLPWAAAKYPAQGQRAASFAAASFAADAAAAAASFAADAADAASAASFAADAAADAADDADASFAAAAAAAFAADDAAADASFIATGNAEAALMRRPLWWDGIPSEMRQNWQRFRAALPDKEDWDYWLRWYEARLEGREPIEAIEIFLLQQDEAFWQQETGVINATFKAEEERWLQLAPRPAPYDFRVVDGKIDVTPETGRPLDADLAEDLRDECLRKTEVLQQRLERIQADANLRADLATLLERLKASSLRPGLILSSLRSFERSYTSYNTEEGRKELSPQALKEIGDLTETLRDLTATFPKSREIEAERLSLHLLPAGLGKVVPAMERSVATVAASDAVTDAAKRALRDTSSGLKTSRDNADKALQAGYLGLDLANFVRVGLRHLKTAGGSIASATIAAGKGARREGSAITRDVYKEFRKDFPKRAGRTLSITVNSSIGALLYMLGADISALASSISAFLPIKDTIEELQAKAEHDTASDDTEGDARTNADDAPGAENGET